jgi:ADP-heptose:LPS heptosyltransferase
MKPLRRIAVLRALQLGDMLCAVPALRALRAAQPRAAITLIGLPWATEFVARFSHYVDELMVLPPVPGLPEQDSQPASAKALDDFLDEARSRRFDLAIQLHGSGSVTNELLLAMGAARNVGFHPGKPPAGNGRTGRRAFLPWQDVEHEVLRCLRLMHTIGAPAQGDALEFPLQQDDFDALQAASGAVPMPGTYACIHPGARMPSRRWPAQRFAQVADRLAGQGLEIVLTGTAAERGLVDSVEQAMHMPALNLAGKTGLGAFAALVSRAALVVCNDSGASHVAAACGTPSVVICCGSDPMRWAPLDHERHRVLAHAIFCRPCMHERCPIGHPCALNISADMVMQQAEELLEPVHAQMPAGRLEHAHADAVKRRLAS